MAAASDVRWIGFDLDDCIGSFRSLYFFLAEFGTDALVEPLLESEAAGTTWFFRPGIAEIVAAVSAAFAAKKINGAFLYSNNGSKTTVRFAKAFLNRLATRDHGVAPFLAGFHKYAAAREGSDKSYEEICNLLHVADLPLPTRPDCVAFFDDRMHVLSSETPHYYVVPKYSRYTPVVLVASALHSLREIAGELFEAAEIVATADEAKISRKKEIDEGNCSAKEFLEGIAAFISE